MISSASPESINLLLFQIGDRVFGADAGQVLRIDRPETSAATCLALGPLAQGDRALVFRTAGGEAQLRVDGVRGLREISLEQLRRVPPVARAGPCALGFWLDGENAVLLIDLLETQEGGR